jgi:hypothetical protein
MATENKVEHHATVEHPAHGPHSGPNSAVTYTAVAIYGTVLLALLAICYVGYRILAAYGEAWKH